MSEEQRRHPRADSLNLSYICLDDNGTTVEQNMGRTLNVSDSGVCLETHFKIDTGYQLILTIALEDETVDLKGEIVFCRPGKDEMFETGVEFFEMKEKDKEIYQKYVRLFLDSDD